VALIYANQTVGDILLREELEAMAAARPSNFHLWYTCDRELPMDWAYGTGHINLKMISDHLLPPGPDSIVAMCGPPGMIKHACLPNLEKLGHAPKAMIQF
jgi:NAD(P)H-flavin reductase